jgi:hypothetical protein
MERYLGPPSPARSHFVTTSSDARRRVHLERMLTELDQRLERLTDTTGALDDAAIDRIAALETTRSALVRLLNGRGAG